MVLKSIRAKISGWISVSDGSAKIKHELNFCNSGISGVQLDSLIMEWPKNLQIIHGELQHSLQFDVCLIIMMTMMLRPSARLQIWVE